MMQMEIRDHLRRFSQNPNVWFAYRRKITLTNNSVLYHIEQ